MSILKLGPARRAPRFLLLLTELAISAAALTAGQPVGAQIERCGHEIDYYSDATFTHFVGMQTWLPTNCACQYFHSGTFTSFRIITTSIC
jgi:hypothetical protein